MPAPGHWIAAVTALLIAWTWLRRAASAIPAWAWGALALVAAFAWEAHQAHRWHARAITAETSLASVKATVATVNASAKATKARVEGAQTQTTVEVDHATAVALDATRADYAALRLRYAALAGRRQPGAMSGPAAATAGVDRTVGTVAAVPPPELVDFAEQGDIWRERIAEIKTWYASQAAVDRTPTP